MAARILQRWFPEYPATYGLLAAYVALFVAMIWLQGNLSWHPSLAGFLGVRSPVLVAFGALDAKAVLDQGQWWRLLTATVLHASLLHLLLNGIALWQVGQFVEEWYGSAILVILHTCAGAAANLVSAFAHDERSFVQVGSSGALFGLVAFAAFVALHGRKAWHRRFWWVALFCLGSGFAAGICIRADNIAHLAGAVVGAVFGMFEFSLRPDVAPKWAKAGLASLAVALFVGCFSLQASATFRQQEKNVAFLRQLQEQRVRQQTDRTLRAVFQDRSGEHLRRRPVYAAALRNLLPHLKDARLRELASQTAELLSPDQALSEDQIQQEMLKLQKQYLTLRQPRVIRAPRRPPTQLRTAGTGSTQSILKQPTGRVSGMN